MPQGRRFPEAEAAMARRVDAGEVGRVLPFGTAVHRGTFTKLDLSPFVRTGVTGEGVLELPDRKLDDLVTVATASPDLRFRAEAIVGLNFVRFLGTADQREKALSVLDGLAAKKESDNLAALAAWGRDTRRTEQDLPKLKDLLLKP